MTDKELINLYCQKEIRKLRTALDEESKAEPVALDAESMAEPVLTLRRVDGDWLVSHGGQELNFGTSVTISLDDLGIVRCDSQEKVVVKPPAPSQRTYTADEVDSMIARAVAAAQSKREAAMQLLLNAMEAQLSEHRKRADKYREAIKSLASERQANARLTAELDAIFTTPPQRKPLTDDEIGKIAVNSQDGISPHDDTLRFARAIERAHGIGSEE
jgi:hypothetical protein